VAEKRVLQGVGESVAETAASVERDSAEVAERIDVADGESFTNEELREFLDADTAGDLADPQFKERLRQKLWEMVERRARKLPSDEH